MYIKTIISYPLFSRNNAALYSSSPSSTWKQKNTAILCAVGKGGEGGTEYNYIWGINTTGSIMSVVLVQRTAYS